jgi:hypothetical protein
MDGQWQGSSRSPLGGYTPTYRIPEPTASALRCGSDADQRLWLERCHPLAYTDTELNELPELGGRQPEGWSQERPRPRPRRRPPVASGMARYHDQGPPHVPRPTRRRAATPQRSSEGANIREEDDVSEAGSMSPRRSPDPSDQVWTPASPVSRGPNGDWFEGLWHYDA